MTESHINRNLCRLCGCKNENGQSLDDPNNAELLSKLQETFSMLVSTRQFHVTFIPFERVHN